MSEATIIAMVAAVAPTIMALAALMQGRANGAKADKLNDKATEIHTLTNSHLAEVTKALEVANQKIEGLQKLVAAMAAKGKGDGG